MNGEKISPQIKVGILVLIGVLILFYMSFRVSKFGVFRDKGYDLVVHLNNASGLDAKTPVQIAGVQIGSIRAIKLDGYRAMLMLFIKEGVRVPVDSKIAIKSQGLLGDKYLEIIPGVAKKYLAKEEMITNVVTPPDFDEIFARVGTAAQNFGDTMGQLKGIIGENEKVDIRKSIENIRTASADFRDVLSTNRDNISHVVSNTLFVSERLGSIVSDVEQGKGTLGLLVKDDKLYNDARDVVTSLKNISNDIDAGKGTLGKLAKDDSIYAEAKETITNFKEITDGIKKGEGSLGKLTKDDNLYYETEKAVKKVQKAADGIQEMTPITILGTIFGMFF